MSTLKLCLLIQYVYIGIVRAILAQTSQFRHFSWQLTDLKKFCTFRTAFRKTYKLIIQSIPPKKS